MLLLNSDVNILPSSEKATGNVQVVRHLRVCRDTSVAESQSWIVPSFDADATALLSGKKAILLAELVWPLSICETALVVAFQSSTVHPLYHGCCDIRTTL
jgi:hypothetical protein